MTQLLWERFLTISFLIFELFDENGNFMLMVVLSNKLSFRSLQICKYAEIEKPREYFEVGLQKDIMCDINQEGQIELVYKTK